LEDLNDGQIQGARPPDLVHLSLSLL